MSEKILDLYKDEISITIVRPENIYGNGQKSSYGYVIHNFIDAVKNNQPIKIYGDGKQTRDFVYIKDVVLTVKRIIEKKIYGKVVSIGLGKGISVLELASLVSRIFNKKLQIEYLPKRQEPRKSYANTKVLNEIGINVKEFVKLNEGIRKLKWRQNYR